MEASASDGDLVSADHGSKAARHPLEGGCFHSYATLVVRCPCVVVIICLTVFIALGAIGGAMTPFDFEDAGAGFEPRASAINARDIAERELRCYSDGLGPRDWQEEKCSPAAGSSRLLSQSPGPDAVARRLQVQPASAQLVGPRKCFAATPGPDPSDPDTGSVPAAVYNSEESSCSYPRLVLLPTDEAEGDTEEFGGSDLMNVAALKRICELGSEVEATESFTTLCQRPHGGPATECCPARSVGSWFAAWQGKECSALNQADVDAGMERLRLCAPWFYNGTLTADCQWGGQDCGEGVPLECDIMPSYFYSFNWTTVPIPVAAAAYSASNGVYDIFQHLVDFTYLDPARTEPSAMVLRRTRLLSSGRCSSDLERDSSSEYFEGEARDVYIDIFKSSISDWVGDLGSGVTLSSVELPIKFRLFNSQLIVDTAFAGGAAVIVVIIVWAHTQSLLIAALGFVQVLMSFGVGMFVYSVVLALPFFPFLCTIMTFVILGIGADDIFVYVDAWKQSFMPALSGLTDDTPTALRVAWTLKRSFGATLVTSLTTSSAFFASGASAITAVRCFAVFAGIVVLADWVMMMFSLPAVVILASRSKCNTCKCQGRSALSGAAQRYQAKEAAVKQAEEGATEPGEEPLGWGESIFRDKIAPFIVKRPIIPLLFTIPFGLVMLYLVAFDPQLKLPSSQELQLFKGDHPIEIYELKDKARFKGEQSQGNMDLYFILGVEPEDLGDMWDPYDKGEGVGALWIPGFDASTAAAQTWLFGFCDRIRQQPDVNADGFAQCWTDSFGVWAASRNPSNSGGECSGAGSDNECWPPCCHCDASNLPMDPANFTQCVSKWAGGPSRQGMVMNAERTRILGARYYFQGSQDYIQGFDQVDAFFTRVTAWSDVELSSAPPELSGGFVSSYWDFYDLQSAIGDGAYTSAGLSLGLALVVLLLTSGNILVSILAMLSIFLTLCMVVGCLILDGWELNITESVTLSIAVGMSVDFTAHLAHGVVSSHGSAAERVARSMTEIGVSITAAAITTLFAGACMMISIVRFYAQFGLFFVLTMVFSWLCSVCCFAPLCVLFGPWISACQLPWCAPKATRRRSVTPATTPTIIRPNPGLEEEEEEEHTAASETQEGGADVASGLEEASSPPEEAASDDGAPTEEKAQGSDTIDPPVEPTEELTAIVADEGDVEVSTAADAEEQVAASADAAEDAGPGLDTAANTSDHEADPVSVVVEPNEGGGEEQTPTEPNADAN